MRASPQRKVMIQPKPCPEKNGPSSFCQGLTPKRASYRQMMATMNRHITIFLANSTRAPSGSARFFGQYVGDDHRGQHGKHQVLSVAVAQSAVLGIGNHPGETKDHQVEGENR